jgi:hypothetical protein
MKCVRLKVTPLTICSNYDYLMNNNGYLYLLAIFLRKIKDIRPLLWFLLLDVNIVICNLQRCVSLSVVPSFELSEVLWSSEYMPVQRVSANGSEGQVWCLCS